jgi:hypothetical protein
MQDGDKRKGYILKPLDEAFANTTVEERASVEFSWQDTEICMSFSVSGCQVGYYKENFHV